MISIDIASAKCIGCGKCVRVCPSGTLSFGEKVATVEHPEFCISCAHCVDVCTSMAITHSKFPPSTLHSVDYSLYPKEESLLMLLRARRSNRALLKSDVPRELLTKIVEAAHLAPTASNAQQISYTIITGEENLRLIQDFTMNHFIGLYKLLTFPPLRFILKPFIGGLYRKYVPSFKKMIASHQSGGDPILRGTRAVIFIHTPKGQRFAAEDCNLAYQNGSLMAECLGVSQIYTGFVLTAAKSKGGKLERKLGIEGRISAGMALGMPAFRYENYSDREPLKCNSRP